MLLGNLEASARTKCKSLSVGLTLHQLRICTTISSGRLQRDGSTLGIVPPHDAHPCSRHTGEVMHSLATETINCAKVCVSLTSLISSLVHVCTRTFPDLNFTQGTRELLRVQNSLHHGGTYLHHPQASKTKSSYSFPTCIGRILCALKCELLHVCRELQLVSVSFC
jgi:hypothetical protein